MIYPEIHFNDAIGTLNVLANTEDYRVLNDNIVVGYEAFDRVGNQITLLTLDMTISLNDMSQIVDNIIEIDVLYDKQTNGEYPNDCYDHGIELKVEMEKRFVMLFQMTLFTNRVGSNGVSDYSTNTSATINGEQFSTYTGNRFNIDLKRLKTHYQSSINDISDITTGGLFIYAFSNNALDINFSSRIKFLC